MYSPDYQDFDQQPKPKFFFIKDLKPIEKSFQKSKPQNQNSKPENLGYAFSPGKSFVDNFDLPKPDPRLRDLFRLRENTTMISVDPIDTKISNSSANNVEVSKPITKGWLGGFSEPTMRKSTVARAKNTAATTSSTPTATVSISSTATVPRTGSASARGSKERPATATVSRTDSASVTVSKAIPATATVTPIGSASARVSKKRPVTATVSRTDSASVTVSKTSPATATVPRTGSASARGSKERPATATVAPIGSASARVSKKRPATATVSRIDSASATVSKESPATVPGISSTTSYPTVLSTRPGWGLMVFPTSFIRRKPEMTTLSPTIKTATAVSAIPKTPAILTTTSATTTLTPTSTTTTITTVTPKSRTLSPVTRSTTAPRWSRFTLPNHFVRRKSQSNAVSNDFFNNNQSAFIRIKPNISTTVILDDSRLKNQLITGRSNTTVPLNQSMFIGSSMFTGTTVTPTVLQDPRFNAERIEIESQILPRDSNSQKYDKKRKNEPNAYAKSLYFTGKSPKNSKSDRNFSKWIVPGVDENVYSNEKSLNSKTVSNFRWITPGKQFSRPNTVLRPNFAKNSRLKIRIYTVIDKID